MTDHKESTILAKQIEKWNKQVAELNGFIDAAATNQPPQSVAGTLDDYVVSDLEVAKMIMSDCGVASTSPSLEPGADPFAERIAKRIYEHRTTLSLAAIAASQSTGADK